MGNEIRSTDVLDDQPVRAQHKRSYVRERVDGPMTERELKILGLEERLRDLQDQLDEIEKKAAQNYRPGFAAEVRLVSRQELSSFPTYSR